MSTIASISGVMLAPGVSKNGRLYTPKAIASAVERMSARIADPTQPPIVMRSHHAAGDDSTRIVGKLVDVSVDEAGKASYRAELHDTTAARDILALADGPKPALRNVSIYGWWLGEEQKVEHQGSEVLTAPDLEIVAVDFTASPGVVQAQVTSVKAEAVELPPVKGKADLRRALKTAETVPDPALRRYVMERADRIGLTNMVPTNWAPDGTTRETTPEGHVIVTESIGEAYVHVAVGDQTVRVDVAPAAETVRLSIGGQPVDESNLYQALIAAGRQQIAEHTAAAEAAPTPAGVSGQHTPETLESAVSDATTAAETAAPTTLTLSDDTLKALAGLVGESINAALDARKAAKVKPAAAAETVEAPAKVKADKPKKTASEKADKTAPVTETKAEVQVAESITKADLADLVKGIRESVTAKLEESRNQLREEIVSAGGVQRRGFRTTETSTDAVPSIAELWENRADILLGDLGKFAPTAA
jgi:hypothetical protein